MHEETSQYLLLVHKANGWVQSKINLCVGPQEPFPATVKRRKLAWFWYVACHDSLSKAIHKGKGNAIGSRNNILIVLGTDHSKIGKKLCRHRNERQSSAIGHGEKGKLCNKPQEKK